MKRNIYIFIVLSLALALPSCKIGKKYARPELDLPEEIVAGADTASIDSISWQRNRRIERKTYCKRADCRSFGIRAR